MTRSTHSTAVARLLLGVGCAAPPEALLRVYLYSTAPHVVAILDADDSSDVWCMPDGSPADPCKRAQWIWRWRVEQRPPPEVVRSLGVLRPNQRLCWRSVEYLRPSDLRLLPGDVPLANRPEEHVASSRCDECRHLFGGSADDVRPIWSQCDECDALEERARDAKRQRQSRYIERNGCRRCDECLHLFGYAERPHWSYCAQCDGGWELMHQERGCVYVYSCARHPPCCD